LKPGAFRRYGSTAFKLVHRARRLEKLDEGGFEPGTFDLSSYPLKRIM
jgi:hypothetical protein